MFNIKLIFILAIAVFTVPLCAQEFEKHTDPIGVVYANFHRGIDETTDETAMEIRRAYLGFKYYFHENYSAELKLDIGSPDDLSEYSRIKRYAFFKVAAIKYVKDNLTINAGLISMIQFDFQEKFWGKRYLYKSFSDEHGFGSSADIGINAIYKLNKYLTADFSFTNGEGYSNPQLDDTYLYGIGIIANPFTPLYIRIHYDFTNADVPETHFSSFIGIEYTKFNLGAEYNIEQNNNSNQGYFRYGQSYYGKYKISSRLSPFIRYDILTSNLPAEFNNPWNLAKDGSAIIGGIEYKLVDHLKIALNYQDWYPYAQNIDNESYIFLNLEFKY